MKAGYYGLVLIAVMNSLISLYYYLRPIVWMYMAEGEKTLPFSTPTTSRLIPAVITTVLVITAFGTIFLGLFPTMYSDWATLAAQSLLPKTSFTAGIM